MSTKPIFVATHPRACSTAFERVFMTRHETLQCVHEPFGDAYYFGPERLGERYENDEKARMESGFCESTYKTILDRIERENDEGKRIFIKDMVQYLVPPDGKPASIAPSLVSQKRGVGTAPAKMNGTVDGSHIETNGVPSSEALPVIEDGQPTSAVKTKPPYPYATAAEPGNPTIVPEELLKQFHFTFLIRHPRSSIPSYYRCTIPPLDSVTGFYEFMPSEAGYDELRRTFDYLRSIRHVGPKICGRTASANGIAATNGAAATNGHAPTNGHAATNGDVGNHDQVDICVIDADDLLDNPSGIIEAYCSTVGIPYEPEMLKWEGEDHQKRAKEAFEKWKGFHEDAIHSSELKARTHKKKPKSDEELYKEWVEKFGEKGAKVIKETVEENVADYEYLKQFALKV